MSKLMSFCFQIYTMAGRRAQPSMMLGSAAVFMDCDENWKLMVVTRNGSLHLWDLQESKRLLHESLGPLLNSTSANSMLSSNGKDLSLSLLIWQFLNLPVAVTHVCYVFRDV